MVQNIPYIVIRQRYEKSRHLPSGKH